MSKDYQPQTVASVKLRLAQEAQEVNDGLTRELFDAGVVTHKQQPLPYGVTQEPILARPLPMRESFETYVLLIAELLRYDRMVCNKIVEWNRNRVGPTVMRRWITNSDITAGLGLSPKNVSEINKRLRIFYTAQINQVISIDYEGRYIHEYQEIIKW